MAHNMQRRGKSTYADLALLEVVRLGALRDSVHYRGLDGLKGLEVRLRRSDEVEDAVMRNDVDRKDGKDVLESIYKTRPLLGCAVTTAGVIRTDDTCKRTVSPLCKQLSGTNAYSRPPAA
jgi:hypothetical protein